MMTITGSHPEKYQGLHLIKETIALSAHILTHDSSQLASQLTGRLIEEHSPAVHTLLGGARLKKEAWLRPLSASLDNIHGVVYRTLSGHTSHINALAILPDSRRVVSASHDGNLRLWDIERGIEIASHQDHTLNFTALCLTLQGNQVLAGAADGSIHLWDWELSRLHAQWSAHTQAVRDIACTPDGRLCVSASNDGSLKAWDLKTLRLVHTMLGHTGAVNAVAISPEGDRAISASSDHTLRIWRLSDGVELVKMEDSWGQFAVAISPDGRSLVSGSERVPILWDLATGSQTILTGYYGPFHQQNVCGVAFTPDGHQVISASNDGTLRIWNVDASYPLGASVPPAWTYHRSGVNTVAVTPNGRWALSASSDQTIKVWNLVDLQKPTARVQSTSSGNPLKWLGFGPRGEVIQLSVG